VQIFNSQATWRLKIVSGQQFMFIIGEFTVKDEVVETNFACDLHRCKGACCTIEGGRGAPLLDEEIERIGDAIPRALDYVDEIHRSYIMAHGFYEGERGDYTTRCIDDRACVFVFRENGIAKCSLERAFEEGKTSWKKPISCHLFPIRESGGRPGVLRTEYIPECTGGLARGNDEGVRLFEFLEEPLRRRFGDEWYERLRYRTNGDRI
jgi:hypothetical protein